ncbi:hypothetical protein CWM94_00080 [Klebsiella pneumoniae]|nr:hypothetical protein CWM94_00080 [Klebsiella pneumoniae]
MQPNNGKFMRRAAIGASWISAHRLMTHYRERRIMARFDDTFGPQALPMDDLALSLESRGLWRRASQRWLMLLVKEPDMRRAEAIAFRRTWCLMQSQSRQVKEPAAIMTENDRVHLHARAKALGCGPVSRHWIEYV